MNAPRPAPPRFVEGGGTDYERQLLCSARRDALPATPRVAERRSLALQAALAAARDPAPTGVENLRASGVGSWVRGSRVPPGAVGLGIVGLGVVGVIFAGALLRPTSSAPVPGEAAPVAMVAFDPGVVPAPPPSFEPPPALAPVPDSTPTVTSLRIPSPARRLSEPVRALPRASAGAREPGLGAEVRAIEHVQTLLGWGETAQAAQALAAYRQHFPGGELSLEADLLDIDLAVARGNRAQATALARALLGRPAASGYRERLNELVAGAAPGNSARPAGSNPALGHMNERR